MTRKPIDREAPPMELSPQQKTALWLYASEMEIADVANQMGISRATAKEHLHRAYRNLGTTSARHAIKVAYETGIFTPWSLRGAADQVEAQTKLILEQQETIQRASEGLEGKTVVPNAAIAAIQMVAMQLATWAHVVDRAGAQRELRTMSNNLDGALRQLGAQTVESPLDGATRGLEAAGFHGVNRIFLGVVLEDHPEVKHLADEWDWSDAGVRDKIAEHVVRDMLGLSHQQYEQAIHDDRSRSDLMDKFWAAHEKWT